MHNVGDIPEGCKFIGTIDNRVFGKRYYVNRDGDVFVNILSKGCLLNKHDKISTSIGKVRKYKTNALRDINGRAQSVFNHRIVAHTFIPNPNSLPYVNHKDENPSNNEIDNLEWCTQQYNVRYSSHHRCTPVYRYSTDGEFEKEYTLGPRDTFRDGYCPTSVSKTCNGKQRVSGDKQWSYVKHDKMKPIVHKVNDPNHLGLSKVSRGYHIRVLEVDGDKVIGRYTLGYKKKLEDALKLRNMYIITHMNTIHKKYRDLVR